MIIILSSKLMIHYGDDAQVSKRVLNISVFLRISIVWHFRFFLKKLNSLPVSSLKLTARTRAFTQI